MTPRPKEGKGLLLSHRLREGTAGLKLELGFWLLTDPGPVASLGVSPSSLQFCSIGAFGSGGLEGILVSSCCLNNTLGDWWLTQHKVIFAPFWGLEVQDQGASRLVSPEASPWLVGGDPLAVCSHCPPSVHGSLGVSLCPHLFL